MKTIKEPIIPDLPEGDPLKYLDLRAVIEYANRNCQYLQQLIREKNREIARLRKILVGP
jgi:hypothetical protein